MKKYLFAAGLLCLHAIAHAQAKKVLFIGNSYTYVNDLPLMVHHVAQSMGDALVYDSNAPGGYTFQMHSTNTVTLNKIAAQNWDYVVLQAQSQEPSFPPAQVETYTYPYAETLVQKVVENDSCSRVLFYMTWGRKNGDAANCPAYPVICTYDGMQGRLRASYLEMAVDNNQQTAPVGVVWRAVRQADPALELYQPDESHPSVAGTYVAACTFYASIFHKPLTAAAYVPAGLLPAQASLIHQQVNAIVFDSLDVWRIDTLTQFSRFNMLHDSAGYVHFVPQVTGNDSYEWIINGTAYTTQEVYLPIPNTYNVALTSTRHCLTSSHNDVFNSTGVEKNIAPENIRLYPNPVDHYLHFSQPFTGTVSIHDISGRTVYLADIPAQTGVEIGFLDKGTYVVRLSGTNVYGTYEIVKY